MLAINVWWMCSSAFLQSTSTSLFARLARDRVPWRVFFSQNRTTSSAVRVRAAHRMGPRTSLHQHQVLSSVVPRGRWDGAAFCGVGTSLVASVSVTSRCRHLCHNPGYWASTVQPLAIRGVRACQQRRQHRHVDPCSLWVTGWCCGRECRIVHTTRWLLQFSMAAMVRDLPASTAIPPSLSHVSLNPVWFHWIPDVILPRCLRLLHRNGTGSVRRGWLINRLPSLRRNTTARSIAVRLRTIQTDVLLPDTVLTVRTLFDVLKSVGHICSPGQSSSCN